MQVSAYFEDFTRRDWQTRTEGSVRMAVVGLGGFARSRALPAIRESDLCDLAVLVSGSPDKGHRLAEEYDADRVLDYGAFHDGTAADAYDAVYVATPPVSHPEYAETAARLGKHVLCEKPLARSVADAERMVAACREAGVTLMTAYRLRTEPAIRRTREMVRDGVVGDPVQFTGGFSSRILATLGPGTWRLDPAVAGGGALMDLGVYPLNVVRFLFDADPTRVWAETAAWSDPFDRVEEHASVHLSFPGGATACCTASFNAHPDNRLHVLGTEGQVLVREPFGGTTTQELVVQRGDAETTYAGAVVDEVREEFDYFATCVLTGADCETDGTDGLADLRIIEAAYESAESGAAVALEWTH